MKKKCEIYSLYIKISSKKSLNVTSNYIHTIYELSWNTAAVNSQDKWAININLPPITQSPAHLKPQGTSSSIRKPYLLNHIMIMSVK